MEESRKKRERKKRDKGGKITALQEKMTGGKNSKGKQATEKQDRKYNSEKRQEE